jgi:di/tricarboxylate transporter
MFSVMVCLTFALSAFMSNTAVVAMMAPMGMTLAHTTGFAPTTMVIGIVLASSLCLFTPVGTVPMTMTLAAGCRFLDYVKTGLPLALLLLVLVLTLTPVVYGT